jgi:tetratricopeptide (TPR) repeat protein
MKRISALCIGLFTLATISVNAQKNELTNTYNDLRYYDQDHHPEDLAKAKIAIDKATADPGTVSDPKTWNYRGKVYVRLYNKELADKKMVYKDLPDAEKTNKAYYETPVTNLVEAANSFLKCKSMKNGDVYADDIRIGLNDCYYSLQMSGLQRFNAKEYTNALPMFELAVDVTASDKVFDTININNAASAALNAKIYDKAISNYTKLAGVGFGKGTTWMKLGRAYCDSGDSAKYISTIQDGLKKYPNDADLLAEDVNVKMHNGHAAEAINELNLMVSQNPNDPLLNFAVGNVYDRMANPDSANGHHAPKPKNYEELLDNAAKYYKKAIELDPKSFDANYNLGVLYYNQAVEYYNRSQGSVADAAKYKDWDKTLPDAAKYLEAAHALEPKDMTTLIALKFCYGYMNDDANITRVKDEIKKLQAEGGQ